MMEQAKRPGSRRSVKRNHPSCPSAPFNRFEPSSICAVMARLARETADRDGRTDGPASVTRRMYIAIGRRYTGRDTAVAAEETRCCPVCTLYVLYRESVGRRLSAAQPSGDVGEGKGRNDRRHSLAESIVKLFRSPEGGKNQRSIYVWMTCGVSASMHGTDTSTARRTKARNETRRASIARILRPR